MITTSFPLRSGSVSGIFVRRLVENLPQDLQVTVIAPGDTRPPEPDQARGFALCAFRYAPMKWQVLAHRPGGVPVALKRNPWLLMLLPPFLLCLLAACVRAARTAHVLHAQWGINGAIACLAGSLTRTPVVTTLQGEDVTRTKRSNLDRMLLRWTLRRSAQVVAVGRGQIEIIGKAVGRDPNEVTVIPNAVEDALLTIDRGGPGRSGHLNLLFVGSLIPRKAVGTVLKAMAEVKPAGSISLVVAGDGPERRNLEALSKALGLAGAVQFKGMIPGGDLPELLNGADAVVLASHSEGLPNVVLEAMAAQLPVIASAIPGHTELIKDCETGLLFPTDDVKALAARLVRVRDDPTLRSRIGRAGRKLVIDNGLTWREVGNRYAELYQRVLGNA